MILAYIIQLKEKYIKGIQMKNKITLIIAAIIIAVISILGTLLYQKIQVPQGPEAAKTALRVTNILEEQFDKINHARNNLVIGYAYEQTFSGIPVSMSETDRNFKDTHQKIIVYNLEVDKISELVQPLRIEAKYDPVVKNVLKEYSEKWFDERQEQIRLHNEFYKEKKQLIKHYKDIQKEMKLKVTDKHYIRLQKSIDTWEGYYSGDTF